MFESVTLVTQAARKKLSKYVRSRNRRLVGAKATKLVACVVACERQTFLLAHRRWEEFCSSRNVPQRGWARRNVCLSQATCVAVAWSDGRTRERGARERHARERERLPDRPNEIVSCPLSSQRNRLQNWACVAWRFCQEHYWAAKPPKRTQSAQERLAVPLPSKKKKTN